MKITLDWKNKNIIIDMKDQINEAFDMFGEAVDDTITSPANKKFYYIQYGQ